MATETDIGAQQFNAALTSQVGWALRADHLYRAAKVLFEEAWHRKQQAGPLMKTQREFLSGTVEWEIVEGQFLIEEACLLLALSFENLLKALWVGTHHGALTGIEKLPQEIKTHNLCILAERVQLIVTDDERSVLRTLSRYAEWRGKYNIPRSKAVNSQAWKDPLSAQFLWKRYPGNPEWPEAVTSLRMKIGIALEQIPESCRY